MKFILIGDTYLTLLNNTKFFPKSLYVLILTPVMYESLHCFTSLPYTLFWDFASIIFVIIADVEPYLIKLSPIKISSFMKSLVRTSVHFSIMLSIFLCWFVKKPCIFWWQALLVFLSLIAEHGVEGLCALLGSAVSERRSEQQGEQDRNGGRASDRMYHWADFSYMQQIAQS